jgi:hypothetical protein
MESKKQKDALTHSKKRGKHTSHYCAVIQQGPLLFGDSTPQPTLLQFCTACDTRIMITVYQQQCSDMRTPERSSNMQLYILCTCKIYAILHKCSQQGYQQNLYFVLFNRLLFFISTEACNVQNRMLAHGSLQYEMFKKGQT